MNERDVPLCNFGSFFGVIVVAAIYSVGYFCVQPVLRRKPTDSYCQPFSQQHIFNDSRTPLALCPDRQVGRHTV